jgi:hypothetical protein
MQQQHKHTEPEWVPSAEYLARIRQYELEEEIKKAKHEMKYKSNAKYRAKVDAERRYLKQLGPSES